MNEYTFMLTNQQVQIVLAGLAELPLKVSQTVYNELVRQAKEQEEKENA